MNKERIIRLLQAQLDFSQKQNQQQAEQLCKQSEQISHLSAQIESLIATIRSLEESLQSKEGLLEKEKAQKKALKQLLKKDSEKITPPLVTDKTLQSQPATGKPAPAERGNNKAKRKEYFDLEIEEHDIYPHQPDFDINHAVWVKKVDSIRYTCIPPRIIKSIYHIHHYAYQGKIVCVKAPVTPLLNSNYDASLIAYIMQLRYIYSLPVERILKLLAENGFELKKSTAHGLIAKAAKLFEYLEKSLKGAILEDDYIHMDETYYTILEPSANKPEGKASSKGYIWSALAHNLNLIHFFYDKGSRARKVFTDYLPADYQRVIQSDGYAVYKILETDEYLDAHRLPCLQHCKRKFLEITGNKDARAIVYIMNELYQGEHRKPPGLSSQEVLIYRETYASPVLERLKQSLIKIKNKKSTLPKSSLAKAVGYALGEYQALCNYLKYPDCELDNNAIERNNRYISLSRKNSLFCATHQGAKNATLIYSLACSCRLNDINTFEYFKDVLNKLANVNPNTKQEELRKKPCLLFPFTLVSLLITRTTFVLVTFLV